MHMQQTEPGWTNALLRMPDYSVVKGFDAGLLKDAKEKWAAAGRDPKKLYTVLRHHGLDVSPRQATWAEAVEHWDRQFRFFIDGGYLRWFAPYVDVVSEANEYAAESTWRDDPDHGAGVIRSIEAAQHVWNTKFRGQHVFSGDGEGDISADCRLALYAGTVSHSPPKRVFEIVRAGDNILDYHGYALCVRGERAADDWPNHSGRAHRLEQEYGIKCRLFHGERAPYTSRDEGWLSPACLNGDEGKLVAVMRAVVRDEAQTPAYREGRLIGAGAFFTSGHVDWPFYQLETRQLELLADMLREEWRPGEGDDDMADLAKVRNHLVTIKAEAEAAIAELDGPQWTYQVRVKVGTLNVRSGPAVSNPDIGDVHAGDVLGIYAERNGWGRIDPAVERWINVGTQYVERL